MRDKLTATQRQTLTLPAGAPCKGAIIHAPERELRSSPDGPTTARLSSECQASVPGNAAAFPAQAKACYPFALAP